MIRYYTTAEGQVMGCDIHMMVEIKHAVDGKESWVNYDHFRKNPYFGQPEEAEYLRIELCADRNYAAFSQLCGVRSYSEETPKISDPRGIPDDACEYTKSISEHWGDDGHSHSYATLAEIRAFRADLQPMPFNGMITTEQAAELDDKGIPPAPGAVIQTFPDMCTGNGWIRSMHCAGSMRRWRVEPLNTGGKKSVLMLKKFA
ncbi:hypothetical protein [Erwinia endophytica]|uniref:hypothetical protein n=1 Tax=Erwinia endophytica TaxID=1563158 RepID=UPI001F039A56|nr:hypothetical protein [Erwinia endophytica]